MQKVNKTKVGIVGCGFVGGALKTWLEKNNKLTYFNAVKEYCEKMGADWAKVHTGVLLSGYINDTHTYVPGPDGKFGYGGKCFPKDVNAFAKMTQGTSMGTLLAPLHELNVHFRGVEEHI